MLTSSSMCADVTLYRWRRRGLAGGRGKVPRCFQTPGAEGGGGGMAAPTAGWAGGRATRVSGMALLAGNEKKRKMKEAKITLESHRLTRKLAMRPDGAAPLLMPNLHGRQLGAQEVGGTPRQAARTEFRCHLACWVHGGVWGRDRQWHEEQQSLCGQSGGVGTSGIRAPWAYTAHRSCFATQ
ncbi:unnamed protein product [Closterium sp. NIES-54]